MQKTRGEKGEMLDFQFSIYKKFRIYTRHGYIASKIDGEAYFSDRLYSLTTLLGGEVADKLHEVSVEVLDLVLRNEAVYGHLAVGSLVQLPGVASQGDGGNGAAGG
ncbi:hypothetical protein ACJQWK_06285 [Exserohilum turcicum]